MPSAASPSLPGVHPSEPIIDVYRNGDELGIVAGLRASFGAAARVERWRHLHLANPVGPSVVVVARYGDAIVGQIASLRRRLRFFGTTHVIAHVLDTMVHPSWQHRGVFPALVAAAEREAERLALPATYGVANAVAKRAAVKYEGRQPLGAFPVVVRPLRPLASLTAIARHHLGERARDASDVTECAASGPVPAPPGLVAAGAGAWRPPRFDARHTDLAADAAGVGPIAFARDADVLAWRYPSLADGPWLQRDLTDGETILATAVVRLVETAGLRLALVMEWHWRRDADAAGLALADEIVTLARRAGAHGIAAMGGPGSAQRRVLARLGFLALPARAFPQEAWPGVRTRAACAGDLRWTVARNWYFTWGDGLTL